MYAVCYPPLSCYTSKIYSEPYFLSTSMLLPENPRKLNLTFIFSNQINSIQNYSKIRNSKLVFKFDSELNELINLFNNSLKTVFIIHGFKNNCGDNGMFSRLRNTILKISPTNVFLVDWSYVANQFSYQNCVANLPILGDILAYFIKRLILEFSLKPNDLHLIGHSMGAQMAALTGNRLKNLLSLKLGKITGLDPAGPYYRNLNLNEKLDSSDADLVEVIYTGMADYVYFGFGTSDLAGRINLYINGGSHQPYCETSTLTINAIKEMSLEALGNFYNCDHHRGFHLIELDYSQTKCQLVAYKCKTYEQYLKGKCGTCNKNNINCYFIGYHPNQKQYIPEIDSKYFLITSGLSPYCVFLYQFIFEISNYKPGNGKFIMHLNGKKDTLANVEVDITPEKSNNVTMLVKSDKELGRIEHINLQFINTKRLFNLITSLFYEDAKLELDKIHINYMSDINFMTRQDHSSILCPTIMINIFKLC